MPLANKYVTDIPIRDTCLSNYGTVRMCTSCRTLNPNLLSSPFLYYILIKTWISLLIRFYSWLAFQTIKLPF